MAGPPQFEGKRTGRPRGARSKSPVPRDIKWAYDQQRPVPKLKKGESLEEVIARIEQDLPKAPSDGALTWWRWGMANKGQLLKVAQASEEKVQQAKAAGASPDEEDDDESTLGATDLVDRLIAEYERANEPGRET